MTLFKIFYDPIECILLYFPWRRKWELTSVFWPGEFHGLYSPWGRKESDTTERLSLHFIQNVFSQYIKVKNHSSITYYPVHSC